MALTREELENWSSQNLGSEEWHHLRIMSHLDGEEKLKKEKLNFDDRT